MVVSGRTWAWLILLAMLAGCGRAHTAPAGTGARETVRDFYEGLMRQDWQQAYDALHPESQNRMPPARFSRLAEVYRRNLGFDPEELYVQSCEEREAEAIAHVVLMGHNGSHLRRYRDAVTLRRGDDGWRVILPGTFGQTVR